MTRGTAAFDIARARTANLATLQWVDGRGRPYVQQGAQRDDPAALRAGGACAHVDKAVISLNTGLEDAETVTVALLVAVGAAEESDLPH